MGIKRASTGVARKRHTSVADALFNKVQQRVLGVLFGNPDRSFFATEIIRLAESGSGAVQRELARLESADLATAQRIGKRKHYQANAAAPVFSELRSLILKTSGVADLIRAALAVRASEIRAAFIYGSIPRGEATAKSDVDLMVVSDTLGYGELFTLLEDVSAKIGRTVNPTLYSSTEFAQRAAKSNAFLARVATQPTIWVIGSQRDLDP